MKRIFRSKLGGFVIAAELLWPSPAAQELDEKIQVRVNAVPVSVSVVDGKGRPVTGLTSADFEVLEQGVPQRITLFSPSPASAVAAATATGVADEPVPAATRPTRKFLILLGRIRQDPLNALEDLADFVERDLRPPDQVAVMAYSRATPFTGDYDGAAALIRAFAAKKAEIDRLLRQREDLTLFAAGMRPPPASTRRHIDALFAESPLGSRQVVDPMTYSPAEAERLSERLRDAGFEATEHLQQALESMGVPEAGILLAEQNRLDIARRIARTDLDVQRYEAQRAATRVDSHQLASAIEYLRFLEGDKYLLFLNARGLDQSDEERQGLTRRASDARVRLYVFQTGGVVPLEGDLALTTSPSISGRSLLNRDHSTMTALFGGRTSTSLMLGSLDKLARETGGRAFLRKDMDKALDETLRSIESNYLLAYTPSDSEYDLAFRTIEVRVRREGARVSHRSGYVALPALTDRERFEGLVSNRLLSAASQPGALSDVPVTSRLISHTSMDPESVLEVAVTVGMSEQSFAGIEDGRPSADLVLGFFVSTRGRSETWSFLDRLTLRLTPENYARIVTEGLGLTRRIEIPASAAGGSFTVVAYQPDRDYLGSVRVAIP